MTTDLKQKESLRCDAFHASWHGCWETLDRPKASQPHHGSESGLAVPDGATLPLTLSGNAKVVLTIPNLFVFAHEAGCSAHSCEWILLSSKNIGPCLQMQEALMHVALSEHAIHTCLLMLHSVLLQDPPGHHIWCKHTPLLTLRSAISTSATN